MRQVQVHQHAAFIDLLVEVPQLQLRAAVVPARQFLIDLAHCFDVKAAVVAEALPLYWMSNLRRTTNLAPLRLWLAEKRDPRSTFLVFGFVLGDSKNSPNGR
ncbi:hypothetical protein D3C76_1159610 [compost metagenome]